MNYLWTQRNDGIVTVSTDGQTFQIPSVAIGTNYRDYKRALRYLPIVRRYCSNLPPAWVIGFIFAENSGEKDVSPKGAVGLMQLLPDTARMTSTQLMNPTQNIIAGCKFLRELHSYPNADLVAMASMYNAGMTLTGHPHPSTKSPFGYLESPGYIVKVISAANEYSLRPQIDEVAANQ